MRPMFKIGDIVVDISESFSDMNLHGIITDIVIVLGKYVYHIAFFGDHDNIMPLYEHEIRKVS